jgi:hypothetical protein
MYTQVLPIKFTPTQYQRLKAASKDQGVPMSQIVRDATTKALTKAKTAKPQRGLSYIAENATSFESDLDKYTIDEIVYLDKR